MKAKTGPKRIENEHGLTLREMMILACIAEGMSRKEIAEELSITDSTVETYVTKMLHRRFKARNQAHMMALAYQWGILKAKPQIAITVDPTAFNAQMQGALAGLQSIVDNLK